MKYGAVFPTCEIGNDPAAIRDYVHTAEDLGYSHLVIYDHVLGASHAGREPALPPLYTERDAFHEPFVLYGYIAALTSRLELSTGVLVLPQRQTALVAKQVAELDLLSGQRFRLGVATGWNYVEYEALGVPFDHRGRRLEEQVALLRALWTEQLVDFDGHFHRVNRAGLEPRPGRPIPIWFGGYASNALRRAARLGDGFVFGRSGQDVIEKAIELQGYIGAAGREVVGFPMEAIVHYAKGPYEWRAERDAWAAAGGTHFSMRTLSAGASFLGQKATGLKTPADHIAALHIFMTAMAAP